MDAVLWLLVLPASGANSQSGKWGSNGVLDTPSPYKNAGDQHIQSNPPGNLIQAPHLLATGLCPEAGTMKKLPGTLAAAAGAAGELELLAAALVEAAAAAELVPAMDFSGPCTFARMWLLLPAIGSSTPDDTTPTKMWVGLLL